MCVCVCVCVCAHPNLAGEDHGNVPSLPDHRGAAATLQGVPGQDGDGSQDEGCEQVGVDVVPGAVQLPADAVHTT